jgi:hypothetical protein
VSKVAGTLALVAIPRDHGLRDGVVARYSTLVL